MSRGRLALVWLACALGAAACLAAMLWDIVRHGYTTRAWSIAIALDQAVNAQLRGWPDETLSARAWRLREQPQWARWVERINRVFGDPRHCGAAYQAEAERRQTAPEYRA